MSYSFRCHYNLFETINNDRGHFPTFLSLVVNAIIKDDKKSRMSSLAPEAPEAGDESQSILEGSFDFILDEIIVNNNLVHHCHLCSQRFLTKAEFKSHLKLHGQQDRYFCQHCSHEFQCSSKLWSHMSRSHFSKKGQTTGKEGFFCSLCDNKAFKQAFNYHLHMLIHLGEQPEKCRFCSKAFRTKPSLRKHELIHTG